MFKKPFKVKTSTAVKGSDRRHLRSLIESSFPSLSAEDLNQLISNKTELIQTKAMTYSGTVLVIYHIGPNPTFFQIEKICYPTVYTLWKYPHLLPTVVTTPPVLSKITNGADLMAPGIIITEATIREMGDLKVNGLCSVRISGNASPIAIGCAIMSKEDLCVDDPKGKAVVITHCFKDTLWLAGDQSNPPTLPETELEDIAEVIGSLQVSDATEASVETLDKVADKDDPECDNAPDVDVEIVPEYTMDEILNHAFMTAVKTSGKKISLPVLTSTFYSSHVLKCCPPSLHLDVKKSSYKKLSPFLKKMQKEGIVQIKELSKGVESITAINMDCSAVCSYRIEAMFKAHLVSEKEKSVVEEPCENGIGNYKFPSVNELFVVSAQVKILFEKFNIKKGDTIPSTVIKDVLKSYVKENSLQCETSPKQVTLDPVLSDCVNKKSSNLVSISWENLHDEIASKMSHAYEIKFENKDPVVKKGKLEPINLIVETRTGNKKVTLVHNLETFGINHDKFCHHVQVAVAASTSVLPTQNGKGSIVMIQGNQLKYLQKLFLESYKVPRKYLQGLENIPKKKK